MKHSRLASSLLRALGGAALSALALAAGTAHAGGTNVGVSVSVSQPGFYGRVDFGDAPPPAVLYAQPIIIHQTPIAVHRRPIYLRVPPGHSKNWARYCDRYSACGQPVYFVRYDERHAPRYDDHRHDGRRYDSRPADRYDDRHDHDRRDDNRGKGKDKNRDKGNRGNGHNH